MYSKKIEVLSLKILSDDLKMKVGIFMPKVSFFRMHVKFLIFEIQTPNRHILEENFLHFKMI